jgi:hypothetical protein
MPPLSTTGAATSSFVENGTKPANGLPIVDELPFTLGELKVNHLSPFLRVDTNRSGTCPFVGRGQ